MRVHLYLYVADFPKVFSQYLLVCLLHTSFLFTSCNVKFDIKSFKKNHVNFGCLQKKLYSFYAILAMFILFQSKSNYKQFVMSSNLLKLCSIVVQLCVQLQVGLFLPREAAIVGHIIGVLKTDLNLFTYLCSYQSNSVRDSPL